MNINYKIIEPSTSKEFDGYFFVRWQVLRKPWNQQFGTEKDELEHSSIHACAVSEENEIIGVGRLHKVDSNTAQIRYMAVLPKYKNKKIGFSIISFLELKAREQNLKKIILHARQDSIGFYIKNGYIVKEKSHLLFGNIQHYLMEKSL